MPHYEQENDMSEQMITGALRMPMPDNPAEMDIVTWANFREAAERAANEIDRLRGLCEANSIHPDSEYINDGLRVSGPVTPGHRASCECPDCF